MATNAKIEGIVKEMATSRKGGEGGTPQRKGNKFKRNANIGEWAWKNKVPTGDQPKTHSFKGKDFIYCQYHPDTYGWVLAKGHQGGCTRAPKETTPAGKEATTKPGKGNKYLKALIGIMQEDDEGEADESGDENL